MKSKKALLKDNALSAIKYIRFAVYMDNLAINYFKLKIIKSKIMKIQKKNKNLLQNVKEILIKYYTYFKISN